MQPEPQIQFAAAPLSKKSRVTTIPGSSGNMLQEASSIRFNQNFAWVMTEPNGASSASMLLIFSLPLTKSSKPQYYDTLGGSLVGVHIEFDTHNNLWVSSVQNNSVAEYSGDLLQAGGNLTPSLTLTDGLGYPQGIGFDKNGNLYVANGRTDQIAVFAEPISNSQPYFLDGVTNPGGIAFDAHGNLYATSNDSSGGAVAEYPSSDLHSGDKPAIVDRKGIEAYRYGSDLAFDKAGNLYDGDCGNMAGIYTYPLATKKFGKTLKPSFYTSKSILNVGCVWGLAIH